MQIALLAGDSVSQAQQLIFIPDTFTQGDALMMMGIMTAVYGLLGVYLDQVVQVIKSLTNFSLSLPPSTLIYPHIFQKDI